MKPNSFLLLLLERAQQSDVAAKIVIRGVTARLMHKPVLFKLGSVEQYRAHFGIRIGSIFVVCGGVKFTPIANALVDFN